MQVRALLEGVPAAEMLANWHTLLPAKMAEWDLDRAALVKLFGGVRDHWIATDLDSWLAPNTIYPGVADPIRAALADDSIEVYIVTTKQARVVGM